MNKKIIKGRRSHSFTHRYSPRDRRAIGIAIMGLGIFAFMLATRLYYLNLKFAGPVVHVVGFVEARYPSHSRYNPRVAYWYPIDGVEFHAITAVPETVFDVFHVSGPLPVEYLPDHPTTNRIDLPAENEEQRRTPYEGSAVAILLICVGMFVFRNACRDLKLGRNPSVRRWMSW